MTEFLFKVNYSFKIPGPFVPRSYFNEQSDIITNKMNDNKKKSCGYSCVKV